MLGVPFMYANRVSGVQSGTIMFAFTNLIEKKINEHEKYSRSLEIDDRPKRFCDELINDITAISRLNKWQFVVLLKTKI